MLTNPRHDPIDGHCYEGCPCLAVKAESAELQLSDLHEARAAVLRCFNDIPDWTGPAAAKLNSIRRYLEKQSHPLEEALLADPEEVQA